MNATAIKVVEGFFPNHIIGPAEHKDFSEKSCTFISTVKELLINFKYNQLCKLLETRYPKLMKDHPLIQLTIMNLNILSAVTRICGVTEFLLFKNSLGHLMNFLSDFLNFGEIRKNLLIILSTPAILKSNYFKVKLDELKVLLVTYLNHILNNHQELFHLDSSNHILISDINKLALHETLCCMRMMWFPKEISNIYSRFLRCYPSHIVMSEDIMSCDYKTFSNNLRHNEEYSFFDNYTSKIQTNEIDSQVAFRSFCSSGEINKPELGKLNDNERVCSISLEQEEESEQHSNTSMHSNCKDKQSCQFQLLSDLDESIEQKTIECPTKNGPFVITRRSKFKKCRPTKQCANDSVLNLNLKKKIKDLILSKGLCFDFTKRENIDKTVMRKFKRYLMHLRLQAIESIPEFWISFSENSFIPPFSIGDLEFKSFCTNYMIWIFSHTGGKELYQDYIKSHLESLVSCFKAKYQSIQEPELRRYLQQLGMIFSQEDLGEQIERPIINNSTFSHFNVNPNSMNDSTTLPTIQMKTIQFNDLIG